MVADPRAAEMVAHFGEQWLGFERLDDIVKDPAVYPDYKPELIGLVRRESDELLKNVWNSGAKLETFLTARHTRNREGSQEGGKGGKFRGRSELVQRQIGTGSEARFQDLPLKECRN